LKIYSDVFYMPSSVMKLPNASWWFIQH